MALTPDEFDAIDLSVPGSSQPAPARNYPTLTPDQFDAIPLEPDRSRLPDMQATTRGGAPVSLPDPNVAAVALSDEGSDFNVSPRNIGRAAGFAGKVSKAATGDVAAKMASYPAAGGNLRRIGEDINTDQNSRLPIEQAMEDASLESSRRGEFGVAPAAGRIALGLVGTLPKIAAIGAAAPAGIIAESGASAGLFGMDDEGNFHPKDAVIGAAMPWAGAAGRKVAGYLIGKMLSSGHGGYADVLANPIAQKMVEKVGEQASLNAFTTLADAPELMSEYQKDPQKFQRDLTDMIGTNLAFGLLGIKDFRRSVPSATKEWILKNADALSKRTILNAIPADQLSEIYNRTKDYNETGQGTTPSQQEQEISLWVDNMVQHSDWVKASKNGVLAIGTEWPRLLAKTLGIPERYGGLIPSDVPITGAQQTPTAGAKAPEAPAGEQTNATNTEQHTSGVRNEHAGTDEVREAAAKAGAGNSVPSTEGKQAPGQPRQAEVKGTDQTEKPLAADMASARAILQMTPDEFAQRAKGFNKINLPLGEKVSDQELEELRSLHDKAVDRVEDFKKAAEADKGNAQKIHDFLAISSLPQFYREAIQRAEQVRAKVIQVPTTSGKTNPNPTPAQAASGNYEKRKVQWNGLTARVETEAGGIRKSKPNAIAPWQVKMTVPYGHFEGTKDNTGEEADVFIGPDLSQNIAYVIDQKDLATGKYDEPKSFIGFASSGDALRAYHSAFQDKKGAERQGAWTAMTVNEFKQWLKNPTPVSESAAAMKAIGPTSSSDNPAQQKFSTENRKGGTPKVKKPRGSVEAVPKEAWLEMINEAEGRGPSKPSNSKKQEEPKAEPKKEPEPEPKAAEPEVDADEERLKELRKRLRAKFGQVGSGPDPEIIMIGAEMAGIYIKKGLKRFADFAKRIQADMPEIWDGLKVHLKGIWEAAAAHHPDIDEPTRAEAHTVIGKIDKDIATPVAKPAPSPTMEVRPNADVTPESPGSAGQPRGAESSIIGEPRDLEPTPAPPQGSSAEVQQPNGAVPETAAGGGGIQPGREDNANLNGLPSEQGPAAANAAPAQSSGVQPPELPAEPAEASLSDVSTAPKPKNIRLTENPAPTGLTARVNANIAAIEVLKNVEREGRIPTDAERRTMAAWSGWGSFKELFNEGRAEKRDYDPGWVKKYGRAYDKLRTLLSQDEFNSAAESSVNAHYTSPEAIRSMWQMAQRLGFKGGKALESSAGRGDFIGFSPDALANKMRWVAVELDTITGKILSHLYPESDVRIQGFERAKLPKGWFDISIGNVPFHETGPGGEYPDLNLHNYFLARQLDMTKPGGIVIAISTHNTMDAQPQQRALLASKGQLVGAIRLPNNAFKESAGTEVVTDILILRKPDGRPFDAEKWENTAEVQAGDHSYEINEYFVKHPEMVLGKHSDKGTMYGANEYTVEGSGNLAEKLAQAIERLPKDITQQSQAETAHEAETTTLEDYSIVLKDGKVLESRNYQLELPNSWDATNKTLAARAKDYIGVRDVLMNQYGLERDPNATTEAIEENRAKMKVAYQRWVKAHGTLNENERRTSYLSSDPGYYTVMGLEYVRQEEDPKDKTKTVTVIYPADVMTHRVIVPDMPPTNVSSAVDALGVSLSYRGELQMDYMRELTGLTDEQIEAELIGANLAFKDPESGRLMTTQEYLTGEVRDKLAKAIFAAKDSEMFVRNVEALKSVIPETVPFQRVNVDITARWTPLTVLNRFAAAVMGLPEGCVMFVPKVEEFAVRGVNRMSKIAQTQWSTNDISASEVLSHAMNFKRAQIMKRTSDDKYVKDDVATALANQLIDKVKEDYAKWIRTSQDAVPYRYFDADKGQYIEEPLPIWDVMEREFNRKANSFVVPDYNGSMLKLPGLSTSVRRTPHMLSGVMRAIQDGQAVFAHGVGSGKAQPLTSKILTPSGWKRMGDIRLGEMVIGQDGLPTRVTGVYPQGIKNVFRVVMSDGAETRCCEEHLWLTQTYYERNKSVEAKRLAKNWKCADAEVRSLAEIRSTLRTNHLNTANHSIPMVRPVEFASVQFVLHPYVLGVLLGDGCLRISSPSFTTKDIEMLEKVRELLPSGHYLALRKNPERCESYGIWADKKNLVTSVLRELGLMGLKSESKFIPDQYLFASVQQRLDLLRGLMDCDGWNQNRGQACCFGSTSSQLIEGVRFLVNSLGGTISVSSKTPTFRHKGIKKNGSRFYTAHIRLPAELVPFSLTRKIASFIPKSKYRPVRTITEVIPDGMEECQCIAVDSAKHLYVTDDFIVTHNTFLFIVASNELRRIGLSKKPVLIVKKPTVGQYRTSIERAYPGSKVLIPSKKDFEPANRKKLIARIASTKWDFIILTHENFKAIKPGEDLINGFFNDQIQQLREILKQMGAEKAENAKSTRGMDQSVRSLVRKIKTLKKRLETFNKAMEKHQDKGSNWENLGIDSIFVDESHNFKKMPIATAMEGEVKGVPSDFSQRAIDLLVKIRDIQRRTNGRNVFFGSGTPVSNSLAELWVQFHATNPQLLKDFGIETFDAFASTYAEVRTEYELGWDGRTFKNVSRLSRFKNPSGLTTLTRLGMDVKIGNKELGLDVPEIEGGKPSLHIAAGNPEFDRWTRLLLQISQKWENLDKKDRFENSWVPIATMRAGVAAALDPRCIFPDAQDHPNSKVNMAVPHILEEWERGRELKTTMMVFADMYRTLNTAKLMGFLGGETKEGPKEVSLDDTLPEKTEAGEDAAEATSVEDELAKGVVGEFNLYNDIRRKLVAKGVPENEIAIITEHDSDKKREELFNKVRAGIVRILIGSTEKIGEGVDVPQRMSAQFHLDPPMQMTPAKLEQRIGRIIRQGNMFSVGMLNMPVRIRWYAQKRSMDAVIWNLLETKGTMVLQALKGQFLGDTFEDPASDLTLAMAEMKAEASGDRRVLEMAKLIDEVRKLSLEEGAHYRRVTELRRNIENEERAARFALQEAGSLEKLGAAVAPAVANDETTTLLYIRDQKRVTGIENIKQFLAQAKVKIDEAIKEPGSSIKANFILGENVRVQYEARHSVRESLTGLHHDFWHSATYFLGGTDPKTSDPRWESSLSSIETLISAAKNIPERAATKAQTFKERASASDSMSKAYTEQFNNTRFDKEALLADKKIQLARLQSELQQGQVGEDPMVAIMRQAQSVAPPLAVRLEAQITRLEMQKHTLEDEHEKAIGRVNLTAIAAEKQGGFALEDKKRIVENTQRAAEINGQLEQIEARLKDLTSRFAVVERARLAGSMGDGSAVLPYGRTPSGRPTGKSYDISQAAPAVGGELTAQGVEEIKALLSDPKSGLSPEVVRVAIEMLNQPVMRYLDWSKLKVTLRSRLDGGSSGAATVADWLIELAKGAQSPSVMPHEIFHFLFEMLPTEDRTRIDQMRMGNVAEEMRKFAGVMPAEVMDFLSKLTDGQMSSEEFKDTVRELSASNPQAAEWLMDLYHLINPSEYLSGLAGETFSRESFTRRNQGWFAGLIERVKMWIQSIVDSLRRALGSTPSFEQLVRELLAGKHVNDIDGGVAAERAVQNTFDEAARRQQAIDQAENDGWVQTEVFGEEYQVRGREQITPQSIIASSAAAKQMLDAAGIPATEQELPDPLTNSLRRAWIFTPQGRSMDQEGQKLLESLRQEIASKDQANKSPDRLANILNSVVLNFELGSESAMSEMSPSLRTDLWSMAQSDRSARGVALAALAGFRHDLEFVGKNVDVVLGRVYADAFGGKDISGILAKVIAAFRSWFSDDEIKNALKDNPALTDFVDQVLALNRRDQSGRVYRKVQGLLKPKMAKTLKRLEADARVQEAVDHILEAAKRLGIEPKPGPKKLSPLSRLLHMVEPGTAERIDDAIARAVEEGERNAGIKWALKNAADAGERQALEEEFAQPDSMPDAEDIEKGLEAPEFAHWKAIRDNLLGYSPTTTKLAQDLIRADFKGTRMGQPMARPADTRISIDSLAKQPQEEVNRVFDNYLRNLAENMTMAGATDEAKQRVQGLVEAQIAEQLEAARKRARDPMFKEPVPKNQRPTAEQEMMKMVNAGVFRDPRLDLREMVSIVAQKSKIQRLTPTLSDLIKATLETPFYRQNELSQRFADSLTDRLGVSPDQAVNSSEVFANAFDSRFAAARAKALERAREDMTPKEAKLFGQKRALWNRIERAVNAGLFDTQTVLQEIARAHGWTIPTEEQIAHMKELAEKEQRMRELTPAERDEAGDNVAKAQREKAAATLEKRVVIKKQMEVMWSRLTRPTSLKHFWKNRRNIAAAINELTSANLLLRMAFASRQVLGVVTSAAIHTPTREIARATLRWQSDRAADRNTHLWKDVSTALKDAYSQRFSAFRASLVATRAALAGRGEARNVDRLMSSIAAVERIQQTANDLDTKGDHGKASVLRIFGLIKLGYRIAQALDNLHGVPAEYQEMRAQVVTELRENGLSPAAIEASADNVIGDMKMQWNQAVARVQQIFADNAIPASPMEISESAWQLVKAQQYERMRELNLPADDFEEYNRLLRNVIGWNERETTGIGGAVGGLLRNLSSGAQKMGIPLPFARFSNAVAISINRSLHFTPFFRLGLVSFDGNQKSPWGQTELDIRQRQIEALGGTLVGGIILAFCALGIITVRLMYPKDKAERDLFDAAGHKVGTMEFNLGNGKFIPISMTVGPGQVIAPYAAAGGALFDLHQKREKEQAALQAEADKLGVQAGTVKPVSMADMMSVAASAAEGVIMGNRTVAGLFGSVTDYGVPNATKMAASQVSSMFPGLPLLQEVSRMAGVQLDSKMASFWDFMVPLPTSDARRVNLLGDPAGDPDAVKRIVQNLTGGTYGPVAANDSLDQAYAALFSTGYRPPSIDANKGYLLGDMFRPMTTAELQDYTVKRGQYFKEELQQVGPNGDRNMAKAAYARANERALSDIGAETWRPGSTASGSSAPAAAVTPSGLPAAEATASGVSRASGGSMPSVVGARSYRGGRSALPRVGTGAGRFRPVSHPRGPAVKHSAVPSSIRNAKKGYRGGLPRKLR